MNKYYIISTSCRTSLENLLREKGVDAVIGCGLAYDICVAATLKDSADLGFFTSVVADARYGIRYH